MPGYHANTPELGSRKLFIGDLVGPTAIEFAVLQAQIDGILPRDEEYQLSDIDVEKLLEGPEQPFDRENDDKESE